MFPKLNSAYRTKHWTENHFNRNCGCTLMYLFTTIFHVNRRRFLSLPNTPVNLLLYNTVFIYIHPQYTYQQFIISFLAMEYPMKGVRVPNQRVGDFNFSVPCIMSCLPVRPYSSPVCLLSVDVRSACPSVLYEVLPSFAFFRGYAYLSGMYRSVIWTYNYAYNCHFSSFSHISSEEHAPFIHLSVLITIWVISVYLSKLFRTATVPLCDTIVLSRARQVW